MADQPVDAAPQVAANPGPTPTGRGAATLPKLYVGVFVIAVIAVECLVAYLYIPTPSRTAAMAGVVGAGEPAAEPAAEKQVEVDLGEFDVVCFQPASNTALRISFHLYGTVAEGDKARFDEAMRENQHRYRDQVIVTVRACELSELTDAGLGVIKRKILEKSNRILGAPLLQTVIFSEFSFIEQ